MYTLLPYLLFLAIFACSSIVGIRLAHEENRRSTAVLIVCGLAFSLAKIWLFQQAPQAALRYSDSLIYQLHATALSFHWAGLSVDTEKYKLAGLAARGLDSWEGGEQLSYSAVLGTSEWLYSAYGAVWNLMGETEVAWAIYSHAALAAFFPAAAFGITLLLGGSQRVALFAAILALIDPTVGAVSSFLLKDTLVSFLSLIAVWSGLKYLREGGKEPGLWLCLSLGLLSGTRTVAFLMLLISLGIAAGYQYFNRNYRKTGGMVLLILFSLIIQQVIYNLPTIEIPTSAATQITLAKWNTLTASNGEEAADQTVQEWKTAFAQNPIVALTKSIMHTLFAPYPWCALWPGLSWNALNELYYPGMLLWLVCLPGIFNAILIGIRSKQSQEWLFVGGFLLGILTAYTIFMGEWSTRQRFFVLPILFSLAAIGWNGIIKRIAQKKSGQQPHET